MENAVTMTTGTHKTIHLKEPGSALTHMIGIVFAGIAAVPLLMKGAHSGSAVHLASLSIFITSMILLYTASTIYHSLDLSEKVNKVLKKIDHMMIFILIAGTYTPICLALNSRMGNLLLGLVWGVAIVGIIIKACWIFCPKWFSSVIYIAMGWLCVLAFKQILSALPPAAFGWLLAGGIVYTIGGIIYALKLPFFNTKHKNFGSHEIFHLFVLGGSLCHFICIYGYIA